MTVLAKNEAAYRFKQAYGKSSVDRPMSALGHKQTFGSASAMSALPQRADMGAYDWNVREGSIAPPFSVPAEQLPNDGCCALQDRQHGEL